MECNDTSAKPVSLLRRKRLRPEQRQEILARFHQGELTQKDFAAQEGINLDTLHYWLRQERESAMSLKPSISFEELKLPQPNNRWIVEIVTPQNYTVRLGQPLEAEVLQQLMRSLRC